MGADLLLASLTSLARDSDSTPLYGTEDFEFVPIERVKLRVSGAVGHAFSIDVM